MKHTLAFDLRGQCPLDTEFAVFGMNGEIDNLKVVLVHHDIDILRVIILDFLHHRLVVFVVSGCVELSFIKKV